MSDALTTGAERLNLDIYKAWACSYRRALSSCRTLASWRWLSLQRRTVQPMLALLPSAPGRPAMPDTPSDVAMRLAEIADHVTLNTEPCPHRERLRCVALALDAAGVAEALEKLKKAHVLASRLTPDHTIEELIGLAMLALLGNDDEK